MIRNNPLVTVMVNQSLAQNIEAQKNNFPSILIIADNPILQYGYLALLEGISCQNSIVSTGQQAIRQVKQALTHNPFQLILLDMELDDSSAIQVCKTIRKIQKPYQHYTPIIAISSQEKQKREEYLAAGCDQIINKRADTPQFISIISDLLFKL